MLAFVVALVGLAFYRGAQQATFNFHGISWDPHNEFCRVSFIAQNPKKLSIKARAFVQLFMGAGNIPVAFPVYVPSTAIAIPIDLAPGQSKRITTDVVYMEKPGGCQHVEVTTLSSMHGE